MEKLRDEGIAEKYRNSIKEKCEERSWDRLSTIEQKWENLEEIIKGATEENIPRVKKGTTRKTWMNNECKEEVEKRKTLRTKMIQTQSVEDNLAYQLQRRRAKQVCRKAKRASKELELRAIEANFKNKEIKKAYKNIREEKGDLKTTNIFYKDKEGNLIGEEEEQLEIWRQYFKEMLNPTLGDEIERTGNETEAREGHEETESNSPTKEEIEKVIEAMKNGKSPGQNEITAENIKKGGEILTQKLYDIITEIWQEERMPNNWNKALILPIYKKGDRTICNNYRGIALLDTVYKIASTLIKQRIEPYAERIIGDYQGGFRKNRSTVDQIFLLKQIMQNCYEYKIPLYVLFIDFQKAYDSIVRKKLYEAMKDLGIPSKLIRLVKMTLNTTTNQVKIKDRTSKEFMVSTGLRQGDPLSALLFNITLEKIFREAGLRRDGTIINKTYQCIAYADDVALLARNEKQLKKVTSRLMEAAKEYGLVINQEKTNIMKIGTGQEDRVQPGITIQTRGGVQVNFSSVKEFVYLGVLINNKCDESREIDRRIAKSNKCAGALYKVIKSKDISRKSKFRIYNTVIKPIVLYGSETWVLNKKDQQKMEIWERRMLRKILGGKKTEEGWERRTNAELYGIYEEATITELVKIRRLQWLGHLGRMEESRTVKEIPWRKIEGVRKRGRPRKRWWEVLQVDLKDKGITNWREKATNRKDWNKLITTL